MTEGNGRPAGAGPHIATEPVVVTDTALRAITEELACHEPERGGALLGPVGISAVTCFVPDPDGATTRSSYRSSEELGSQVRAIEEANPLLEFKGIIHSHPGAMDSPSGQDRVAFADSLALNPWMPLFIAPIVVCRQPWWLDERSAQSHRLGEVGWMTMWVAGGGPRATVAGRQLRALYVERDLARLPDLGLSASGPPVLIEHEGEIVLAATLTAETDSRAADGMTLVFPWDYPVAAPLVVLHGNEPDSGGAEPKELLMAWDSDTEPEDRLLAGLRDALPSTSTTRVADPCQFEDDQAGLRRRLGGVIGHKLVERSVAVVGVGSVGSHMAEFLVRSGVERIDLVDPDVVEAANLSRCPFVVDDVGRPKVDVVAARLRRINRRVVVRAQQRTVDDLAGSELVDLVRNADLLVAATDDPAAQIRMNHHAYVEGTPAVYPAIYGRGRGGEVIVSVPDLTPCFRCATAGRSHLRSRPQHDYGTGRLVAEPALGADILHVTTTAAKLATSLLNWSSEGTDLDDFIIGALAAGSYLMVGMTPDFEFFNQVFDGTAAQFAYQSVWLQPSRAPDCSVCGDEKTRVGPSSLEAHVPDVTRVAICAERSLPPSPRPSRAAWLRANVLPFRASTRQAKADHGQHGVQTAP